MEVSITDPSSHTAGHSARPGQAPILLGDFHPFVFSPHNPTLPLLSLVSGADIDSCFIQKTEAMRSECPSHPAAHAHRCPRAPPSPLSVGHAAGLPLGTRPCALWPPPSFFLCILPLQGQIVPTSLETRCYCRSLKTRTLVLLASSRLCSPSHSPTLDTDAKSHTTVPCRLPLPLTLLISPPQHLTLPSHAHPVRATPTPSARGLRHEAARGGTLRVLFASRADCAPHNAG